MKIFKTYFIISFILFGSVALAQSSSAYTRYGIGNVDYTYSARAFGLAHTGTAMLNRDYVEILNPASWAALKLTRIEFSLILNGVNLSDANQTAFYSDADFKGFTFAFPISSKYGIGFASGLIPYSRVSYQVVERNTNTPPFISDYTTTYEGKGGLSRLFMGATVSFADWVFGATAEYYFGTLRYISKIDFDVITYNPANLELDYRPRGFGSTVGLISQNFASLFNSKTISNLRIGVSANIIDELVMDTLLTISRRTVPDTLGYGETTMKIPVRLAAGITMGITQKYVVNIDYIYQPWSQFNIGGVASGSLRDVNKISAAFEYIPTNLSGSSAWEQIQLRAGLSYEQTQYRINGVDINQYSVFAGFSYPLGIGNSLDVGFEYSDRGTTESGLIREQFFRINVGLTFGELWFIRQEK